MEAYLIAHEAPRAVRVDLARQTAVTRRWDDIECVQCFVCESFCIAIKSKVLLAQINHGDVKDAKSRQFLMMKMGLAAAGYPLQCRALPNPKSLKLNVLQERIVAYPHSRVK